MHVELLVIGAGPTGVGAAVRAAERGLSVLAVERSADVGGAAGSHRDDAGFVWDVGGHVLHNHFASFAAAIAASGVPMHDVVRNGQVWIDGRFVPTPIQQQLDALPADVRPGAPARTLEDFYRNEFGAELHERFFAPFTTKMWAFPLDRLDHEWTSLRSGSGKPNVPALRLGRPAVPAVVPETFPYPRGGTGALWDGIVGALVDPAALRRSTAVVAIDTRARAATLEDGSVVTYDACVSTAPLPALMRWAGLPDRTVPDADGTAPLTSSTVHAVGLGFEGDVPEALADKTYVSSPDADVPWYRLTVLSNYDRGNAGEGRWSVLAETSTSSWRPVSPADALHGTRRSLARLGADLERVVSTWTRLVPMGYPLPTLGRDDVLRDVDAVLTADGIRSRGRFGGWRYESCNQDYSYSQGMQAVDAFVDGSPEDVYWHPERF